MAAGEIYQITGALNPSRPALKLLGGDVDDGVQIDTLAVAAVGANHTSGTLSAWIMVPDVTGTYAIVGFGDASAVEYIVFQVVAGKLKLYGLNGANVAFDMTTTNVVLTPYKWHHVALVQDAKLPKFYVDGVVIPKADVTETDITEAGHWFDDFDQIDGAHIGATDSLAGGALLTEEFKGLMGQVTIWSGTTTAGALTAAQIKLDYERKDTGVTPYGQYTFTDAALYTNAANPGTYDGTKVGDFTRVNTANEFTARLQYEPAVPLLVADVMLGFSVEDAVGYALVVKAA